jgi:hypothetical protein
MIYEMIASVTSIVTPDGFQDFKLSLLEGSGLAKDALHIHIGLAIFVITRLCWRWRGGWIAAWIAALGAALGGEWLDIQGEFAAGALQPDTGHWHDIWNTMLWPTALLLIGRWLQPRPRLAAATNVAPPSGEDAEQPLEQA